MWVSTILRPVSTILRPHRRPSGFVPFTGRTSARAIEATYPDDFASFNARLSTPDGFPRPNAARERRWKTDSGRAAFHVSGTLCATGFGERDGRLRLMTILSNDQFNTTLCG
jgi:hypothetical protein